MRASVDRLTEGLSGEDGQGLRILNVGFGLGIVSFPSRITRRHSLTPCFPPHQIDTMFQTLPTSPLIHTIIEPHPSVLEHMTETGWTTEAKPNLRVLKGKWQDWVETEEIYEQGGYDVIYFDTFSEGYEGLSSGGYLDS
jgi:type IV protein arginine methyltransferase